MANHGVWDIIDVHAHLRPPGWQPKIPPHATTTERAELDERTRKLTNAELLVEESEQADVGLRLLSATVEGFFGTSGPTDPAKIAKVNDHLAEVVSQHPHQLAALATVDAFSGAAGAKEAERAVIELGHVGIVVDSSRNGFFINADRARPTLELAADLKVPVLVHPVAAPNADTLIAAAGTPGNSFGRGLINGVAFLSLLRSGILRELPNLHVIFTAIGSGALVIAAEETPEYAPENRLGANKPNVYFDIMGLDPAVVGFLVDFLGADRVVVGSDWPIWSPVTRQALTRTFDHIDLNERDRALIAGDNARRLLNLRSSAPVADIRTRNEQPLSAARFV